MRHLRAFLSRLIRFRPLDRGEFSHASRRPLDIADGLTAADAGDVDHDRDVGGLPPAGWVKDYDEGRPRT